MLPEVARTLTTSVVGLTWYLVRGSRACVLFFFFQAEDGIRDLVRSRGLGDVYKRQATDGGAWAWRCRSRCHFLDRSHVVAGELVGDVVNLSLIHI